MTEKEILQAKHRQEEWEAREKVKARKARTRRLIQEGAILEKAFPIAQRMGLEQLQAVLYEKLSPQGESLPGAPGKSPDFLGRGGPAE